MTLPPSRPPVPLMLPGTVIARMVRCGKPACHCAHGDLHGPYYYRRWREAGKVRKTYVPLRDLEAVRAACEAQRVADLAQAQREREYSTNSRMEADPRDGRQTARLIARALAAARTQANIGTAKEIGKDAAAVTAHSRHLEKQAVETRRRARVLRGAEPPGLTIHLRPSEDALVLELTGGALLPSSETLGAALDGAVRECAGRRLVVDLRGVTQMDGSAWDLLVGAARELHRRAVPERLCLLLRPGSGPSHSFAMMGLHLLIDGKQEAP